MRNQEKSKAPAKGRKAKGTPALNSSGSLPGKPFDPSDENLRIITAAIRIGKGKFQKVELIFYGNPFKPPVMIRAARTSFRDLVPIDFTKG